MDLAENIERVQELITRACVRAGRDPSDVALVAVSKTFPAEAVVEAYRLGLRDFGENRVEEASEKTPNIECQIPHLQPPALRSSDLQSPTSDLRSLTSDLQHPTSGIRWHLVGHLQSRKAREAVALFDMIHSVDSAKLADKLSRWCAQAGRVMPILLECNVSGEESKYGFPVATKAERERWMADVETIVALPGVRVEGLMTVAPIVADAEEARPVFRALRELRDQVAARFSQASWRHLSMGMTDDLAAAIAEGATIVRVGRAIFGERRPG